MPLLEEFDVEERVESGENRMGVKIGTFIVLRQLSFPL